MIPINVSHDEANKLAQFFQCQLYEDIPTVSTTSPMEDVAIQDNSNEVRLGPMTRSRTKLIEQQVNSLLVDYDNLIDENFILPKSMHLCMIRYDDNTSASGGKHQVNNLEHGGNMKTSGENNFLHDENKHTSGEHMKALEDNIFTSVET